MASIFTRIIAGELPGRFVYRDDRCVAILTIAPLKPGHTLVIPIEEIDHWLDVPEDLSAHLFQVAARIGRVLQSVFQPEKVGLIIAGLEVRHVHLHLVPIWQVRDLDFSRQEANPDPTALDVAMEQIRAVLDHDSDHKVSG
jgi:diadenosine tetraphosphate (Ap4A) HIT family hydrolase